MIKSIPWSKFCLALSPVGRRGGEGIIDLDPNNANQWGLPDGLMRKSMELQLNLVVLKYTKPWGSTCDKMFDIFAESWACMFSVSKMWMLSHLSCT